jgi:SAM-dependent methyltransferase
LRVSAEPGRTFGRVADAYARTRPRYAPGVVDRAAELLELEPGATVLDLAAGTGNLTTSLRRRFASVVAVEPDDAMRAHIDGDVLAGTAEAIPLADGAVDAVFVGEAFHWFDWDRALVEIQRVVRSGGGLAVIQRAWGEQEQPGLLPRPFKEQLDAIWARFHGDGTRDFPDWVAIAGLSGPESHVDVVQISGRDLVDLHLTASTPASIDDAERAELAERAYPLMEPQYGLRVVSNLYWRRFP